MSSTPVRPGSSSCAESSRRSAHSRSSTAERSVEASAGSDPTGTDPQGNRLRETDRRRTDLRGLLVFTVAAIVLGWAVMLPLWILVGGEPVYGARAVGDSAEAGPTGPGP